MCVMKLGREKNLRPTDRRTSSSQRLKSNGARYDAMTFRTSEVRCVLVVLEAFSGKVLTNFLVHEFFVVFCFSDLFASFLFDVKKQL